MLSSPRLDYLYQYQAIVSEAPYDRSLFLVNPLILRLIAWLHLNPYNLAWRWGSALVRHNRRNNHCIPLSSPKALLTEIWQWLHLVLRHNSTTAELNKLHMDHDNVDTYITHFAGLARKALYYEDNSTVLEKFKAGLSLELLEKCMHHDGPPKLGCLDEICMYAPGHSHESKSTLN